MSLTFIDFLCGAGGSSTGLVESGLELKLGVNHWKLALATHAANHRNADHLCIDVSGMPMRYLPSADVLWASVICTEISPAGGRRRQSAQLDLLDGVEEFKALPDDAFEKTRVTAWCVVRAAEAKRFRAIVVENVLEFASDWILFPQWIAAMKALGYNYQITSVSSAHIGDESNLRAPQWRDRIYITFTRQGDAQAQPHPGPARLVLPVFRAGPRRPVLARPGGHHPQVRQAVRLPLPQHPLPPAGRAVRPPRLGRDRLERPRPAHRLAQQAARRHHDAVAWSGPSSSRTSRTASP